MEDKATAGPEERDHDLALDVLEMKQEMAEQGRMTNLAGAVAQHALVRGKKVRADWLLKETSNQIARALGREGLPSDVEGAGLTATLEALRKVGPAATKPIG